GERIMQRSRFLFLTVIIATFVLLLAACGDTSKETNQPENGDQETGATEEATVEITDAHGVVTVPVNPSNVVSLDSRSFELLDDWGIELVAAPVPLLPDGVSYLDDESIQDIGNHREPNLEIIAAADPDLVIVGQRFGSYYEDIVDLVPDAVVIDVNFDVSEEAETP